MISVANKYKRNGSSGKAPTGMQNAIEPVITFIRDEVAMPNLGEKSEKYLPYLLTVFFFILINNIFGLIPAVGQCNRKYCLYTGSGGYFIYRDPVQHQQALLGAYFQSAGTGFCKRYPGSCGSVAGIHQALSP